MVLRANGTEVTGSSTGGETQRRNVTWHLNLERLFPVQVHGGKRMYTCALRPTGVYGDGDELIRNFYKQCVQRGGLVVQGVPEHIEHGRVYAGKKEAPLTSDHPPDHICSPSTLHYLLVQKHPEGPKAEAALSRTNNFLLHRQNCS